MSDQNPLEQAKHPRSLLAGPYGHPFHPILVTIPIGAWTASFVFDLIGFFASPATPWVMGADVLIAIGLVSGVVAAAVGLLDYATLAAGTPARRTARVHMLLNVSALVLFTVGLLVRLLSGPDRVSVAGFVLSVVALAGLTLSGWLGTKLAHRWGVRAADESTQIEGFLRPAEARDRTAA